MKVLGALSVAATTLMFLLVSSAWAGTNVVPNPGFEQGGCGSTPVFCGWSASGWMTADTTSPHSGSASMLLQTCAGGCNADDSWTSASAFTDPAFCSAIGPGIHPASFWSAGGEL